MNRSVLILLKTWIFIYPCFSFAQNLVANYSFEDTISCPVFLNELNKSAGWFRPTSGSSDLLHSCSVFAGVPTNPTGIQNPRTGDAYAGIITYLNLDGREYIETKLTSALEQDKNYCLEFFVSLADSSGFAIDRIGAVLSVDSLLATNGLPLPNGPGIENPTGNIISDAALWTSISGKHTADGGEKFITIGNFYYNDSTDTVTASGTMFYAYYYIDDVSVYLMDEIPPNQAGSDTTICMGESISIGSPLQVGYVYNWQEAIGISDTTAAEITLSPTVTTTYILYIEDTTAKPYTCKVEAWDTITVTVIDCDTLENIVWLPNIFSPNGDGNNDVLFVRGNKINSMELAVYSRWGEKVFESFNLDNGWDGTYKGEKLNSGVFVYMVRVVFEDGTERELKGNVTLVR